MRLVFQGSSLAGFPLRVGAVGRVMKGGGSKHNVSRSCQRTKKRRFSTTEVPGPGPSRAPKEDVAIDAAKTEAFSNKMMKHLLWAVPLVSTLVLITIVCSNRSPKDFVESISPGFIDFVRDQMGFDEEEMEEDERVNHLEQELALPVNVIVTKPGNTQDSVTIEVSGNMLYMELLEKVRRESPGFLSDDSMATGEVQISFSSEQAQRRNMNSESDTQQQRDYVPVDQAKAAICDREEEKILSELAPAMRRTSDEDLWLVSHSSWKQTEGEWRDTPVTAREQKDRVRQLLTVGVAKDKNDYFMNDAKLCMRLALSVPYQNYASYALEGIHDYCKQAHINIKDDQSVDIFHILLGQTQAVQSWYLQQKQEESLNESTGKPATAIPMKMSRGSAMKRIADLKLKLAIQQRDFELGRKGFDESVAEIQDTNDQITHLQRKYINKFYFF